MKEIIIRVSLGDEGYYFDICDSEEGFEMRETLDGGLCTSTLANSLDMAAEQAKELVQRQG